MSQGYPKLADLLISRPTKRMTQIRIAWKIGISTGGGHWITDNATNREQLGSSCYALNLKYGHGTHWIEEREA